MNTINVHDRNERNIELMRDADLNEEIESAN